MRILIALFLVCLLAACAGTPLGPSAQYQFTKYDENGQKLSEVKIVSDRNIEDLNVGYNGGQKTFEAQVGKLYSPPNPIEVALADTLPLLLDSILRRIYAIPIEK